MGAKRSMAMVSVAMVSVTTLATAGLLTAPGLGSVRQGAAAFEAAHVERAAAGPRVATAFRPSGFARMTVLRSTGLAHASYSTNWSGIAGTSAVGVLKGAGGTWAVPKVAAASRARYASTWVGVDGVQNSDLIQTGTDEDVRPGQTKYDAWIEILPAAEQIIGNANGPAVVKPGDAMTAYVKDKGSHHWTIYIADNTRHWDFDKTFTYKGPGDSAEWIEEAPTINGAQSTIANFGSVVVKGTVVYVKGSNGKFGWYSTALGAGAEITLRQKGTVYATSSQPLPKGGSSSGQHFTVRYH